MGVTTSPRRGRALTVAIAASLVMSALVRTSTAAECDCCPKIGGAMFNFTQLMSQDWTVVEAKSGGEVKYDFRLAVCRNLKDTTLAELSNCGSSPSAVDKPSACQKAKDDSFQKPMGSFSATKAYHLAEGKSMWKWNGCTDDAACDKSAINKGVRLTVKKGDGNGENICHSKYERKVEIDFQCGTGLGAPVFVSEETNCLYRFEWRTELACEDHAILPSAGNGGDTDDDDQPENTNTNTNSGPQAPDAHLLDCTYTDDKQGDTIRSIDLNRLSKPINTMITQTASGSNDTYTYHVSVCRSLTAEGDTFHGDCAGNVGVCQTKQGDTNFAKSLGAPSKPMWDSQSKVIYMEYKGGTHCNTNNGDRRTRINFQCDQSAGEGAPTFAGETGSPGSGCLYTFEWRTAYACARTKVTGDLATCRVKDDVRASWWYDLAPIRDAGALTFTQDKQVHSISVCKPNVDCGGQSKMVCVKDENGQVYISSDGGDAALSYNKGTLELDFTSTNTNEKTTCPSASDSNKFGVISTKIRFECPKDHKRTNVTQALLAGTKVLNLEKTGCQYTYWMTAFEACPPLTTPSCRLSAGGKKYDLGSLRRSGSSEPWSAFEQDDQGNNKYQYLIDVCSPIPGNVCTGSADQGACVPEACLNNHICQKKVGSSTEGWGVSQFQEPPTDKSVEILATAPADGTGTRITLNFTHGDYCHHGDKHRMASVVLICDPRGSTSSGPRFIAEQGCTYLFEWSTPAACPVVEGQETAHGSCRIDSGGANIDLTSLQRQSESSDVQGTILQPSSSDMKYAIGSVAMGVCRAVTCGSDTGAGMCLDTPSGKVSLGRFNQNLEKLTDGAKLTYKDGATCAGASGGQTYASEVTFLCAAQGGSMETDKLVFQGYSECTYLFHYMTDKVCGAPAIECEYITPDGKATYDLSRLVQSDQRNYIVQDAASGDSFHINVCHKLTSVEGCPDGVGVCQVPSGQSAIGLGTPTKPTVLSQNADTIVINYGADACKSQIQFKCPASETDEGEAGPKFLGYGDCSTGTLKSDCDNRKRERGCEPLFAWTTRAACKLGYEEGSSCAIHGIDFSPLKGKDWVAPTDKYDYKLRVCEPLSGSCGTSGTTSSGSAAACQVAKGGSASKNMGGIAKGTQSQGIYEYNGMHRLWYKGGQKCHSTDTTEGFERQTVVEFKCDPNAGTGQGPTFVAESGRCSYLFSWYTDIVCQSETILQNCATTDSAGKTYDLSVLRNHGGNYRIEGSDGSAIELNVCRTLHPLPGGTEFSNEGEVKNMLSMGAVMVMPSSNSGSAVKTLMNLGKPAEPKFDTSRNQVYIEYSINDAAHSCYPMTTRVYFKCKMGADGPEPGYLGQPVMMDGSDKCKKRIEWETSAGCELGKAFSSSHCQVTNSVGAYFDLSSLAGKVFTAKDKDDKYTFDVAICGDTDKTGSACGGMAACQTINGDGKQKGMGKFHSKDSQLQVLSDKLSITYVDGTKCHNGKYSRTTQVAFVCDDNAHDASTDTTSQLKFVQEYDDCKYYFEFHTPLACEKRKEIIDKECTVKNPTTGALYDLSSLKQTGDGLSYIASDAGENNQYKYFINVCHSLTSTQEYDNYNCDTAAGACQVELPGNDDDGAAAKAPVKNLGQPSSPTLSDAGKLQLKYESGTKCSSGKLRMTVIEFNCDKNAGGSTVPKYIGEGVDGMGHCEYKFTWDTPAACPIGGNAVDEAKDDVAVLSSCQDSKLNGVGQKETAVQQAWWDADSHATDKYTINACGAVTGDAATNKCSVCLYDSVSRGYKSLGQFRNPARPTTLDGYVIDYTAGDSCPDPTVSAANSEAKASARVTYKCGADEAAAPVFESFNGANGECMYSFTWSTPKVCTKTTELKCIVENSVGQVNLKQLMKKDSDSWTSNWLVKNEAGKKIILNVCGGLISNPSDATTAPGSDCQGSAVCVDGKPGGKVADEPEVNDDGYMRLWYPNKEVDPPSGASTWQQQYECGTEIVFLCQEGEVGTPLLQDSNKECVTSIHWSTSLVCPPKADVQEGKNCKVESETTGLFFDMNSLKKFDYPDVSADKTHVVAMCQTIDNHDNLPPACKDAAVCFNGKNWGVWNDAINLVESAGGEPEISIHYKNGDRCTDVTGQATLESKIVFKCDPTATVDHKSSVPVYNAFASTACTRYYDWPTESACKVRTQSECLIQDTDGSTYDLSALRRTLGDGSDWVAEVTLGDDYAFKYSINVCGRLVDPKQPAECREAAACQIEGSKGKTIGSTSYLEIAQGSNQNNPDIKMHLTNGEQCNCHGDACKKSGGTYRKSIVTFKCPVGGMVGTGNPTFVREDSCKYYFDWVTDYACKEHKQTVEASSNSDCALTTPFTGVDSLDFAKFASKAYSFTQTGEEYKFGMCGQASGCPHNADACVRKVGTDGSPMSGSAGDWASLGVSKGFTMFGDDISYKFKDSNTNAAATIDFECDYDENVNDDGTAHKDPRLIVNSNSNVQLVWATALACPPAVIPCVVQRSQTGETFDLGKLTSVNADINVAGVDDGSLYINVCKSVVQPGCPPGAGACFQDSSGSYTSLGQLSPRASVLKYKPTEQTASVLFENGGKCGSETKSTELTFTCDKDGKVGSPTKDASLSTSCKTVITWKTCKICAGDSPCGGSGGGGGGSQSSNTKRPVATGSSGGQGGTASPTASKSSSKGWIVALVVLLGLGGAMLYALRGGGVGGLLSMCTGNKRSGPGYRSLASLNSAYDNDDMTMGLIDDEDDEDEDGDEDEKREDDEQMLV